MEFRTHLNSHLLLSFVIACGFLIISYYKFDGEFAQTGSIIIAILIIVFRFTASLYSITLTDNEIIFKHKYAWIYTKKKAFNYNDLELVVKKYLPHRANKVTQKFIITHKPTKKKVLVTRKDSFKDSEQVHQQLTRKFGVEYKPIIRKGFFSTKRK